MGLQGRAVRDLETRAVNLDGQTCAGCAAAVFGHGWFHTDTSIRAGSDAWVNSMNAQTGQDQRQTHTDTCWESASVGRACMHEIQCHSRVQAQSLGVHQWHVSNARPSCDCISHTCCVGCGCNRDHQTAVSRVAGRGPTHQASQMRDVCEVDLQCHVLP